MPIDNLNSDFNHTRKIIWGGQQTIRDMSAKWLVTTISNEHFLDITSAKFDEIKQKQRQICKAPFPSEYLD